jgi:hypothetical protein
MKLRLTQVNPQLPGNAGIFAGRDAGAPANSMPTFAGIRPLVCLLQQGVELHTETVLETLFLDPMREKRYYRILLTMCIVQKRILFTDVETPTGE